MSAWVIYLLYVLLNAYAIWQTVVLMKRIIAKKWPAVLSAVFLALMGDHSGHSDQLVAGWCFPESAAGIR